MYCKVLQRSDGKYLEGYSLESSYDDIVIMSDSSHVGVGVWVTDDIDKAMRFYTSMSAIVARNYVGYDFVYKNIEITK